MRLGTLCGSCARHLLGPPTRSVALARVGPPGFVSSLRALATLSVSASQAALPSTLSAVPLVAAQPLAQVADPLRQPRLASRRLGLSCAARPSASAFAAGLARTLGRKSAGLVWLTWQGQRRMRAERLNSLESPSAIRRLPKRSLHVRALEASFRQPRPPSSFSLLVARRASDAKAQRPRRAALREGNPCTCPGCLSISAVPVLVASSLHCFEQFVSPAPIGLAGFGAAGLDRSQHRCSASFSPANPLRSSAGCGPTPRSSRRPTTALRLGLVPPLSIMRHSPKPARLRGRLSSNVRPHNRESVAAVTPLNTKPVRRKPSFNPFAPNARLNVLLEADQAAKSPDQSPVASPERTGTRSNQRRSSPRASPSPVIGKVDATPNSVSPPGSLRPQVRRRRILRLAEPIPV